MIKKINKLIQDVSDKNSELYKGLVVVAKKSKLLDDIDFIKIDIKDMVSWVDPELVDGTVELEKMELEL